jgi:hypothetical protein
MTSGAIPEFARKASEAILCGRLAAGLAVEALTGEPVPPALIACKAIMTARISSAAKAIGGVLIEHIRWSDGRCDPGLARLCELTGYARSNVQRGITQLVDAGLLVVRPYGSGVSHRNAYDFDWEEIGRRYEGMALRAGRLPPRKQGIAGPENRAQTLLGNPENKPLNVVGPSAPAVRWRGRDGRSGTSEPTGRFNMTQAGFARKETTAQRREIAFEAAVRRLNAAVAQQPDRKALWQLDPEDWNQAASSEMSTRNTGIARLMRARQPT